MYEVITFTYQKNLPQIPTILKFELPNFIPTSRNKSI